MVKFNFKELNYKSIIWGTELNVLNFLLLFIEITTNFYIAHVVRQYENDRKAIVNHKTFFKVLFFSRNVSHTVNIKIRIIKRKFGTLQEILIRKV